MCQTKAAKRGRALLAGLLVVVCSIARSPSELPNAAMGTRPITWSMPTALPGPSSSSMSFGSAVSVAAPPSNVYFASNDVPITCSGGMP